MAESEKDVRSEDLVMHPEWNRMSDHEVVHEKEIKRIVSSISLFSGLSKADWNELAQIFHHRTFKDQEIIFEIGTPGLGMYVILNGEVRIIGEADEQEVEYARLKPGDFFGEMSLIDESKRSATAVASGETSLIGVFRPQLKQLIHSRPKLGVILLERLSGIVAQRLRDANLHWETDFGTGNSGVG